MFHLPACRLSYCIISVFFLISLWISFHFTLNEKRYLIFSSIIWISIATIALMKFTSSRCSFPLLCPTILRISSYILMVKNFLSITSCAVCCSFFLSSLFPLYVSQSIQSVLHLQSTHNEWYFLLLN